uniref:Uncharacterized protein n=1 Tax=Schmidtea mediterranea TaxID=79327 RepID=A0A1S6KMJ3_SCHMD|nr:hypothetical protein 9223 [Schmidtea mediterranea]
MKNKILSVKSLRNSLKSKLKTLKSLKKSMIKSHQKSLYKRQRNKFIIDLHKNSLKMSSNTRKFFEIKLKAIKEQLKSHNNHKPTNLWKEQLISIDKSIIKLQNYAKSLNILVNERLKRGIYLKRIIKLSASNQVDKGKIKRINKALKTSKSKDRSLRKQMKISSITNLAVQQKRKQNTKKQPKLKHHSIENTPKINPVKAKISNRVDNKNIINKRKIKIKETKKKSGKSGSEIINNSKNPSKNKLIITASTRSSSKIVKEKNNQSQIKRNQPIATRAPNANVKLSNNQMKKERKLSIESERKIMKIEKKIEKNIEKIVDIEYMTRESIKQESSIYKKILIKQ